MNVLITANYAAPKSGNFVASLIALGRRLRQDGNTVCFVFPKQTEWINWFKDNSFTVEIFDADRLSIDKQFTKLNEVVKKYKIDIIHTHFGMFRQAIIKNRKRIKK